MNTNIHPVTLGLDHCYLIQGEKTVLIDGGSPKQVGHFKKLLEQLAIKPEEIDLILLTHGHWDHIGSAKDIKEMTGAKVAIHQREQEWVEKGLKPLPPGVTLWGRIVGAIMSLVVPFVHIPSTKVDVVFDDDDFSLADYGIPGKVIYTPGHSSGSVTVLLDSGDAFVGDLAMNKFPLRLSPGLPIFAEDLEQVIESWQLLLERGVKTVYPAHGKPFSANVMRTAVSAWRKS